MSDLRTLFPDTNYNIVSTQQPPQVLYVTNTAAFNSAQNGGRCCLWTVPAGTRWAKFEVYGAGGDGGGGCCCQQGRQGGGSGSYARRTIRVVPGESYTLCAAGTGCCAQSCQGTQGFPSFACNATATFPLCLCASGGGFGQTGCFLQTNGCISWASSTCGSACGFDFAICGHTGANYDGVYCGFDGHHMTPFGVYEQALGMRYSFDNCLNFNGCSAIGNGSGSNTSHFGAGGGSANTGGGACCWGGFGHGGLVIVTFQ